MISSLNNFAARRAYKYVLFACAHYTITYSIFPERIQNMKKVKQILEIRGKLQKKHTLFAKKEKKGKEKKVHREKANKGNVLSTV